MAQPRFAALLVATLVMGAAVAMALPSFFQWIGNRPGMAMHDPLLAAVGPLDVSVATFTVLYGTLVLVLASVAGKPVRVLRGLCAYVLILLLRMAAMALLTLEPPPGIIPLIDPFTQAFYPGADPFLKDLFFSGHTATLTLAFLLAMDRRVRWIAALGTAAIAMLVLVQHVHWTVDVIAAPPAAWMAWKAAERLLRLAGITASEAA